jgi:phosphoglycolate phosphatase
MNPLLVFDLDGTLIDSAPDICRAVNRTLTTYGKNALTTETIVSHIGEGLKKLIADLFAEDNLPAGDTLDIEGQFLRIYEEEMFGETRIYPGVEEFLTNYQGPMAIITNKNELPAKAIIKHLGLHRFPWVNIFGADTLAERKPSPLGLQTMMKLAGHAPENTFMIGDGIPDMVSAKRAGVPSIAIGFGYTTLDILQEYEPVAVLEHYSKMPELLTRISYKKQLETL